MSVFITPTARRSSAETSTEIVSSWWVSAVCRSVPITAGYDPFYPREGSGVRPDWSGARTLCGSCPVIAECLAEVMAEEPTLDRHGFRGGLTPGERTKLHERRGRRRAS